MEYFRFMSKKEFDKLIKGEELKNNKKHEGRTGSKGFCFMKTEDNAPEYAYEFLSGVVDDDVCVVFETDKKLNKSWGVYADPYGSFFSTITEDEYCTTSYDKEAFRIVRMAMPKYNKDKWKWEPDVNKISKRLNKIYKEKEKEEQEFKEKEEIRDEILTEKCLELREFFDKVNEEHKIEVKIGDRYYKMPCLIKGIKSEPGMLENNITVEFETYLSK